MFGKNKKNKCEDCIEYSVYDNDMKTMRLNHSLEIINLKNDNEISIKKLEAQQEIALNEKEFEIRHQTSDEVLKLKTQVNNKDTEIAVLKQKVEMLDKIVDINSDIIDVKQLVSDLIGKLPEIKITSLGGGSKEK